LLVVNLGVTVFGVHEESDAARCLKDLHELFHGRHEQCFSDALPLMVLGHGQAPQPDSGNHAWQLFGLLGR